MKKWVKAFLFGCICKLFCDFLGDIIVIGEMDAVTETVMHWFGLILSILFAILYLLTLDKSEEENAKTISE